MGFTPWSCKELDMAVCLSTHWFGSPVCLFLTCHIIGRDSSQVPWSKVLSFAETVEFTNTESRWERLVFSREHRIHGREKRNLRWKTVNT